MIRLLVVIVLLLVSACSQDEGEDVPLPTRFPTSTPITETATASPTPTLSSIQDLPPSYTPTPPVTPSPIPATPTPGMTGNESVILFIAGGNSIMSVRPDGSDPQTVISFGDGRTIQDMTPSPDGSLVAFVAPGSGSANEVWISSLDGGYLQQVSCVGLPVARMPVWHPDGERLAFFAGDETLDLYIASYIGSNACPEANGQRQLAASASSQAGGLAFSPDGETLYFSDGLIYALDVASGDISDPLTEPTVGGTPAFELAFAPEDDALLTYLRDDDIASSPVRTGFLIGIDVETGQDVLTDRTITTSYEWGMNGETILFSSEATVYYFVRDGSRLAEPIAQDTNHVPHAVFSPDETQAAYVGGAPESPQVFITSVDRADGEAVTELDVETIEDLVWTTGS